MLHQAEIQNTQWEQKITEDIRTQCERIQKDGDIPNFVETLPRGPRLSSGSPPLFLDYYTTLRVKTAFQRMNLQGIQERLRTVEERIGAMEQSLRHTAHDVVLGSPEDSLDPTAFHTIDEGARDDPTSLCVPLPEDYRLP